ncbi:MAG: glycosyltransferase [Alicyclobacillus sp.]|nr:glycosyltransferase [Alicyclobacillus sp.]
MATASAIAGGVLLLAWLWLLFFRGGYWRTDLRLDARPSKEGASLDGAWPSICAIVPARNEADMLPHTLGALLEQMYDGPFSVVLVDDHSDDGTADAARRIAAASRHPERLTVVSAPPLPAGWAGKVWAMHTGIRNAPADAAFFLFTDADIHHPPHSVARLVEQAQTQGFDLVSLMVRLRFETFWGALMIPAFVYFFAKLYPFRWVSTRSRKTAAAAGGSLLVRSHFVQQEDGLTPMAGALIDDCAMAKLVQSRGGALWLGLGDDVTSLRAYPGLRDVWNMVARSAFVQLRYSGWWLFGTVIGMLTLYAGPVVLSLLSLGQALTSTAPATALAAACLNLGAWLAMTVSFAPILRWYRVSAWCAPLLPVCGFLYTCMTVDSARRFFRRQADAWKGRPYQALPGPRD